MKLTIKATTRILSNFHKYQLLDQKHEKSKRKQGAKLFSDLVLSLKVFYVIPAKFYLFKVNNRNTRTRCQICSKLTIKTVTHFALYYIGGTRKRVLTRSIDRHDGSMSRKQESSVPQSTQNVFMDICIPWLRLNLKTKKEKK